MSYHKYYQVIYVTLKKRSTSSELSECAALSKFLAMIWRSSLAAASNCVKQSSTLRPETNSKQIKEIKATICSQINNLRCKKYLGKHGLQFYEEPLDPLQENDAHGQLPFQNFQQP
jgi:hypothetical protein